MKYDDDEGFASGETDNGGAGGSEALLRAEIGFWRELLSDCDRSLPPESIERMRQALALAEHRYLQLWGRGASGAASSDGPARASRAQPGFLH